MKSRQLWTSLLAIALLAILLTGCQSAQSEAATTTPTASGSSVEFSASQATMTPVKPTATPTHAKPTPTPTPVPPTPTPKPVQQAQPTQPPAPTPTPKPARTGVNGNPWGYDFDSSGSVITSPAAGFCGYFTCVSTFWTKTNGYVVECGDGHYSHSGGVSGACSRNGGVAQILYSH